MPISTGRNLHVDALLSQVAINYAPQAFVADQICPIVPVPNETGGYAVFNQAEFFAVENTVRSRGGRAKNITRSVGTATYAVKNHALRYDVPLEDRANMDAAFAFEFDAGAARYLVNKLALGMEQRVLTLANAAASVSTTFVPNSSWDGNLVTTGDPIQAINRAAEQMKSYCGQFPNAALVGWKAHKMLMRNYHVRGFIKGVNNGGGAVTRQQLASALELSYYNVAEAQYNSANEAGNTVGSVPTLTSVFAQDNIILYHRPSAPSRDEPSWMYGFNWVPAGHPGRLAVERHPYDGNIKADGIEASYYQDEKVVGAAYAIKIAGVGSAQSNGI